MPTVERSDRAKLMCTRQPFSHRADRCGEPPDGHPPSSTRPDGSVTLRPAPNSREAYARIMVQTRRTASGSSHPDAHPLRDRGHGARLGVGLRRHPCRRSALLAGRAHPRPTAGRDPSSSARSCWLRRAWVRPSARDWLLLIGCGIAWFAVYNIALNAAELELDAGTTAMLVNVGPILIAVLAGTRAARGHPALAHRRCRRLARRCRAHLDRQLRGRDRQRMGHRAVPHRGSQLRDRRHPAEGRAAHGCRPCRSPGSPAPSEPSSACPSCRSSSTSCSEHPRRPTWGVVYLGAVPTALAFTTWAYALSRMPAGRLGVTTYIVPPLTIVIAWWLLGEVPAPLQVIGGVVCLVGVALSRFARPAADRSGDRDGGRRCRGACRPARRSHPCGVLPRPARRPGVDGGGAGAHGRRERVDGERASRPAGAWRTAGRGAPGPPSLRATCRAGCRPPRGGAGRRRTRLPPAPDSYAAVRASAGLAAARTCYDHLAGRLGVDLLDALDHRDYVSRADGIALTASGAEWLESLGVDVGGIRRSNRPVVRLCLDWTERRSHLAGGVGAAIAAAFLERDWIRRADGRAIPVTDAGRAALQRQLGPVDPLSIRRRLPVTPGICKNGQSSSLSARPSNQACGTPLEPLPSVHPTLTAVSSPNLIEHTGELWLSRFVSSASERSAHPTTASSSPTRAPSATVA